MFDFGILVDAPTYPEWRAARQRYLTASDVAGVMGLSPHSSLAKVLKAKLPLEPGPDVSTSAMRAGGYLEDGVMRWWVDDLNRKAREEGAERDAYVAVACRHASGCSRLYAHPDQDAALAASPDGLLTWEGMLDALVEVKVTNPTAWAEQWGQAATKVPRAWTRYSSVEPPSFGRCPLRHYIQLQTQLLCTGMGRGYVVGACGTVRMDLGFDADPAIQQHILTAARDFRERLVAARALELSGSELAEVMV